MVWCQTQTITSINEYHPSTHMTTSSNGNIFRVTGHLCGEFRTQRPVTRSFDVFFHLRLNIRLGKQSWGWWFETPFAHYDVTVMKGKNASPSLGIWVLPFRIDTVSIFREEISKNEAGLVIGAEAEETVFAQQFSFLSFVCKKVHVENIHITWSL